MRNGMHLKWDKIWTNAVIARCKDGYDLLDHAAIATQKGKIAWIGKMLDLPASPEKLAQEIFDCQGSLITPGFIDCHTHVIFAGDRAQEFERRLQGASYEEIARLGGGIHSTVLQTKEATPAALFQQSLKRVKSLISSGVTTLEIKSGYGLDLEKELKMLRVADEIKNILPITIIKTFLGAHTLPKQYQERREAYVDAICDEMIPAIAKEKLADAIDVFCEKIAFNIDETERIFKAAKKFNLAIKCHAEQLSNTNVSALAASYGALSVDHLEHISEENIKAIAKAGTVAVLLPGAFYFLRESKLPPIDLFRQHQVPIAIATDCNPGTSPMLSLQLMLNMACTLFQLTPEEALLGVTQNAAKALNMEATHGTLQRGKVADLAIWNVNHPRELAYYAGGHLLKQLIRHGQVIEFT